MSESSLNLLVGSVMDSIRKAFEVLVARAGFTVSDVEGIIISECPSLEPDDVYHRALCLTRPMIRSGRIQWDGNRKLFVCNK